MFYSLNFANFVLIIKNKIMKNLIVILFVVFSFSCETEQCNKDSFLDTIEVESIVKYADSEKFLTFTNDNHIEFNQQLDQVQEGDLVVLIYDVEKKEYRIK